MENKPSASVVLNKVEVRNKWSGERETLPKQAHQPPNETPFRL